MMLPNWIGEKLHEWHGGMYTDVYRVASSTTARRSIPRNIIEGAVEELKTYQGDEQEECDQMIRLLKQHLGEESIEQAILDGAARAFFVDDWAFWEEEEGDGIPAGVELLSYAPATTEHAVAFTREFLEELSGANDDKSPEELFFEACIADESAPTQPLARDFGHYIAMEAMGHGVSWFDNHAHFEIEVPYKEYYV